MSQVSRQDEATFDQRDNQHGDHRHRHDRDELAHHSGYKRQRQKRDDGGGYRSRHAGQYFDGAFDGGSDEPEAFFAFVVNVFPNHDRIVDHNPQRHQESKHRQHVHRLAEDQQDESCTKDRNWNSHGDPKRESQFEENREYDEYQQQPLSTVSGQQFDSVVNVKGNVAPSLDGIARRHCFVGSVTLDGFDDRKQIFLVGLGNLNDQSRASVDQVDGSRFSKTIDNVGDVSNSNDIAIGFGDCRQVSDADAVFAFVVTAKQHLLGSGRHFAARHVDVLLANHLSKSAKAHAELAERIFGDFDRNFVGSFGNDFGGRNRRAFRLKEIRQRFSRKTLGRHRS